MNFCVVRIIGNELPPRDEVGSRLKSLRFVIDKDNSNIDRRWILNRIYDQERLAIYKKMLSGEKVTEIPFDKKQYRKKRGFKQKILYSVNINAARNLAFKENRDKDFIFILDGDCFFEEDMFDKAKLEIEEDQKSNENIYYGMKMIRMEKKDKTKSEPMMILRNDASELFDENIEFGNSEKIEMILRTKPKIINSHVSHLSFSKTDIEENLHIRLDQRSKSLVRLIKKLDTICFKIHL